MDITRRLFVKSTAIALATAAAGGSLAMLAGCTAAPETTGTSEGNGDTQTYSAVCRFCGCGCGVICEAKDGRLISVTGDPDNQSSKGLNCVKGYYLAKILYGEDRLTKPLIRDDASTKGTPDGLREASWEEALDLVASKLRRNLESGQNPPRILGFRPAAHHRRLSDLQALESRLAFQQHRPERTPVHGKRGGRLHERVPDRRACRLLR